jgi:hypothetical protein
MRSMPYRHKVDLSRHQQRPFQRLGDVDTKFGKEIADHVDQLRAA